VDTQADVVATLRSVLGIRDRQLDMSTPLLGAVPELDSMAVVSLLTAMEDRFGITIDDDEVDGQIFATVGSLVAFIDGKVAA
jgi:acyl carrier protein